MILACCNVMGAAHPERDNLILECINSRPRLKWPFCIASVVTTALSMLMTALVNGQSSKPISYRGGRRGISLPMVC